MKIKIGENSVELFDHISFPSLIRDTAETSFIYGKADDPFYVCDLGDIVRKHALWKLKFPRIEPFYAIKCNPDPLIVRLLSSLSVNFDCASKGEISQVLSYGVHPSRIIYANPCKQISHIRYAESSGVLMMTFDSIAELKKIAVHHPSAKLVLRIFVGATKARCPLGLKFGAPLENVQEILRTAFELKLDVVGVSFHVGSGCFDASAYRTAIAYAKGVFDEAHALGIEMYILDIGGGFPGNLDSSSNIELFDEVCDTINDAIKEMFPVESNVRIIAEPGRYYVSSAFQLACTVTSVRSTTNTEETCVSESYSYFLNDGVYGSFNCIIFDHYLGEYYLLENSDSNYEDQCKSYKSTFWGPTCDSMDKIIEGIEIRKLNIGERVVFKNMGAYTMAAGSTFNGFERPFIRWTATKDDWISIAPLLGEKFDPSDTNGEMSLLGTSAAESITAVCAVDLCEPEYIIFP